MSGKTVPHSGGGGGGENGVARYRRSSTSHNNRPSTSSSSSSICTGESKSNGRKSVVAAKSVDGGVINNLNSLPESDYIRGQIQPRSSISRFLYWLRFMFLIDSVTAFIARSSVYILPQAPFCDGLALMVLFFQLPPWITGVVRAAYLVVLGLYGWPYCSGHSGGGHFFAVFNQNQSSGGFSSNNTYDLCPSPPNFLAVLTSDLVILIFMRVIPKFDHFVTDFSTGLVATSLAGAGPIVTFRNAAYCILLFYLFRCFLQFLSVLFSFSISTPSDNFGFFGSAASYVTNLAILASEIVTTTSTATSTSAADMTSSVADFPLRVPSIPSSSLPTSSNEDLYLAGHDFGPTTHHNREEDTFLMLIHWIATAVSTHLIGCGFVLYIRRAFFADYSSNKPSSNESPGNVTSLNPQAHSTSVSSPVSGQINNRFSSLGSSSSSSSFLQSFPSESPGESPAGEVSDAMPTSALNKRKRRIYTRLQQPLWSALATFIVVTFRGRSSFLNVDINASILASLIGYASTVFRLFGSRNNKISLRDDAIILDNQYGCVRSISENVVVLEVLKVPGQDDEDSLGNGSTQPKIKKSLVRRPADFNDYAVRVNGILWPQVTIHLVKGAPNRERGNSRPGGSDSGPSPDRPASSTSSNSSKDKEQSLDNALVEDPPGEQDETLVVVTGLAQRTEYELELLHLYKGGDSSHVIFKTTISTLSRIGSSSYAPARPLSPMSTLLDTLTAASNELSEQRALIRRMRRDNARKIGQLRSEIDSLKSKVVGNDENQKKTEERSWRRVLALRESIRRNEDDIENLTEEIDRLNVEKLEVIAEHEARHAVYVENMQALERDETMYQEAAASLEREKSAHLSEEAVLLVRLEKSSAKRARLQSDYDKEVERLQNFGNAYLAKLRETRMATISRRLQIKESFAKAVKRLDEESQEAAEKSRILWDTLNQVPGPVDSGTMLGGVGASSSSSSPFRDEVNNNMDASSKDQVQAIMDRQ